jgi:hypothetical protein
VSYPYKEDIALTVSFTVLTFIARAWNEIKTLESLIPQGCVIALAVWAAGLGVWAVLSLKDQGRLSKLGIVAVIFATVGIVALAQ